LMALCLISSVTLNNIEKGPVYENPVIVKNNGLSGGRTAKVALNTAQLRALAKSGSFAGQKQGLRNDLTRGFSLKRLSKWVDHLSKEKVSGMSNDAEIGNLQNIKTMSINMQTYIHQTCAKISSYLKILDLKIKEINSIDKKILSLRPGSFKKGVKKVKANTLKLKKAMKREKAVVKKVMVAMQKKQKNLLKVLSVYDKKFASKNQSKMQNLLSSVNLQLKPYMSLPYFHQAYSKFVTHVLSISKNLSQKQLSNPQATSSAFIKKLWKKYLAAAKKEWEKKNKNHKKKGRKHSPIKKIK